MTIEELFAQSRIPSHQQQFYASTGGQRVLERDLVQIADRLRAIASEYGYPDERNRVKLAGFDRAVAHWLTDNLHMIPGEGYRSEVWSFLGVCLWPDLIKWRFAEFHYSRVLGGRRNCFQRLWMRGRAFDLGKDDPDRWAIVNALTEDAFVSIMERPSLAGNHDICKSIGNAWLELKESVQPSQLEQKNRDALKRLRASLTLINLDAIETIELDRIVRASFRL